MKRLVILILLVGFALKSFSQESLAKRDSVEILLKTIESLKIDNDNIKDSTKLSEHMYIGLEASFENDVLQIIITTMWRKAKRKADKMYYLPLSKNRGSIKRNVIPISGISRVTASKDTTPWVGYESRKHFSTGLGISSKMGREYFGCYSTKLSSNEEKGGSCSGFGVSSRVREDYPKLKRIKGILDFLVANDTNPLPEIKDRKIYSRLMNGVLIYEYRLLDEAPVFKNEKDKFGLSNNIKDHVFKNSALTEKEFDKLHCSIVLSDEGKVIDVLFFDETHLVSKEEIEEANDISLTMEEYNEMKEKVFDMSPNKDLKRQVQKILFKMPKWTPGKLNGKPVNTWIVSI